MNTFLPFPGYSKSVECLDNKRLNKQKVECIQILRILAGERKGWQNHPAVVMWRGYEPELCIYTRWCIDTCISRGFKDTQLPIMQDLYKKYWENKPFILPPWFKDDIFHRSQKSNLMRKLPEHYSKFFEIVPNLPYAWPVENKEENSYSFRFIHSGSSIYFTKGNK